MEVPAEALRAVMVVPEINRLVLSTLTERLMRTNLADLPRLAAYRAALGQVVRPGDTVLDLGSGTGVLAVLAAQAGAGHVYAVDASDMLAVARAVVAANGVQDRVTLLNAHSRRVELPERVDVVVADQMGPVGLEAGLLECFADARRRLLKPGGTLVPFRLHLVAAPLSSTALWEDVAFWDRPADGIDVRAVQAFARNVRYYAEAEPDALLGPGTTVATLDPGDPGAAPITTAVELPVARAGPLHGIAVWFAADLAEDITISNGPDVPDRLQRSHVVLPLIEPVPVEAGDVVHLDLHIVPPDALTRWRVVVRAADGTPRAESRHSTVEGRPITREHLQRTRADHVPTLGPRGRARATALGLMDGAHTLAEIEAAVWAAHGDAFASQDDAAAFVAHLIAGEAG
jgi:SAM-dependent methyltransferase